MVCITEKRVKTNFCEREKAWFPYEICRRKPLVQVDHELQFNVFRNVCFNPFLKLHKTMRYIINLMNLSNVHKMI